MDKVDNEAVATQQQRELDLCILDAIKLHMKTADQMDRYAGLLIELTDPASPLFITNDESIPSAHALLSYPGALFQESDFAVLPTQESDNVKLVEVLSFKKYNQVCQSVSSILEKELLSVHRPKLVLALGKDIHSVQLANEFGLDHINSKELGVGNDDMLSLLQNAIVASTNTRGILIDGFPSTVEDAIEFEKRFGPISAVLNFNSSFVTNNSVEAIKRRLFGFVDNVDAVEKPLIKYFGSRVIPVKGNGDDESQYQEAWAKLFAAGLFSRDQNIVLSIGNGSYPAEANLLSSQLAINHNLALVRLGSTKYQSEALVSKCLELLNTNNPNNTITTKESNIPSQTVGEKLRTSHTPPPLSDTDELTLLRQQVSALLQENKQLSKESKYLQRALIDAKETHTAEVNVLLSENKAHQDTISNLENELTDLKNHHSALQTSHTELLRSSLEKYEAIQDKLDQVITERDGLTNQKGELETQLSETQTLFAGLTEKHDLLIATHQQLQSNHTASEDEAANRKIFYEAQIAKLKEELVVSNTNRDDAVKKMEDALFETDIHAQRQIELETIAGQLNLQLVKASEKYKKSRAKELEVELDRMEQAVASLTAETQFLKSLLGSERSSTNLERSSSSGRKMWSFLEGKRR
ncbi:hypothetical protein BDR26DRAFT_860398 [Obelidium mucronatum]|nr:hypothetical protein BDR26DRAFT_860398 [Obelidium mucronatum]